MTLTEELLKEVMQAIAPQFAEAMRDSIEQIVNDILADYNIGDFYGFDERVEEVVHGMSFSIEVG